MRHETISEPNSRAAAQALKRQLVPRLEDSNATSQLPRIIQLIQKRTAAAIAAGGEEASTFPHPTNGDEELYAEQAFAGNFSKTLPHDPNTGLVEPFAYEALLNAVQTGTLASFGSGSQWRTW